MEPQGDPTSFQLSRRLENCLYDPLTIYSMNLLWLDRGNSHGTKIFLVLFPIPVFPWKFHGVLSPAQWDFPMGFSIAH